MGISFMCVVGVVVDGVIGGVVGVGGWCCGLVYC